MSDTISLWRPVLVDTALTFLASVGALQITALRNDLEGLAWPVGTRHRVLGYALASVLLAVALLGGVMVASLRAPLAPLLQTVTLLAGIGTALVATIVGGEARLRHYRRHRPPLSERGSPITLGPAQATFCRPSGQGPFPGVCLLPDPVIPEEDLTLLVRALVERGIAVLIFDWQSLDNPDRLTMQGLVAVGFSRLARWPEAKAKAVGLVGVGLGGDLALRSAAMDAGVAAVLAMEPVLSLRRPGLGVETLRGLSWFGAHRRVSRWRRSPLVRGLDGLTAIPCIPPRPVAILTGSSGRAGVVADLELLRIGGVYSLTPATHAEAVARAADWLVEHLT